MADAATSPPALQVVWTRTHVPAGRFELTDPAGASVRLGDDAQGWPAWVEMLPADDLETMRWWADHYRGAPT